MNELISVIIPIYKVENYLRKCIDTVLAQSYTNLEIILVDDGSPDNCGQICDEYCKLDSRIVVIHKRNGGLSDARNAGLDVCKGAFISFIDSDDFVSPFFIEVLYKTLKNSDNHIATVNTFTKFIDAEENQVHLCDSANSYYLQVISARDAIRYMMYQRILNGAQWRLYPRRVWKALRFPVGYLYEDVATIYKAMMQVNEVILVDAAIYAYRIRSDSIMRQTFTERKMICIAIGKQIVSDIGRYDKALLPAVYNRAFSMIYNVFLQVPKTDHTNLRLLFTQLVSYRKQVLRHPSRLTRTKNILGAVSTCLGMDIAFMLGRSYLFIRDVMDECGRKIRKGKR